MKLNLFCIAVIIISCFSFSVIAQSSIDGIQKNLQTNTIDAVSYTTSTFSKQNIFYNRFSIFAKSNSTKADTIYIVDLNFDKSNHSINILQADKKTNQTSSKTIKFYPLSNQIKKSNAKPIYSNKNYNFNDTLLSLTIDNNTNIHFTIDDTISPIILLHQFVSIDGTKKIELDKFRKSHLTAHLSHARDYWQWYRSNSIKRIEDSIKIARTDEMNKQQYERLKTLKAAIDKEKLNILEDKDSMVNFLSLNRKLISLNDTIADKSLHQGFVLKMDNVFAEYFNKTLNFSTESSGSYKIYVNANKSKRIIENHTPETFSLYFKDQFAAVNKFIDQLPLENEEIFICNDEQLKIIAGNHIHRFDLYNQEAKALNYSLDSVFAPILNTVDSELKSICREKIKITTLYNYNYHISNRTEWQKWIFTGKKIKDSHRSQITNQDLLFQFYNKNIKPKKGRYAVSLNTTEVNNRIYEPKLDSIKLKYKFITRVGFNLGTFIISEEPETDTYNAKSNSYNFDQRLWNVFVIHHHFGIFAGSTFNPIVLYTTKDQSVLSPTKDDVVLSTTTINKYREGGMYLAPGRGLFFKFGLGSAQFEVQKTGESIKHISNTIKPILGASLIFPVVHLEGGYNFVLNYPYIMAGFNLPFNL